MWSGSQKCLCVQKWNSMRSWPLEGSGNAGQHTQCVGIHTQPGWILGAWSCNSLTSIELLIRQSLTINMYMCVSVYVCLCACVCVHVWATVLLVSCQDGKRGENCKLEAYGKASQPSLSTPGTSIHSWAIFYLKSWHQRTKIVICFKKVKHQHVWSFRKLKKPHSAALGANLLYGL